jgi:phage/plasmid primase-like uncharacterized protein
VTDAATIARALGLRRHGRVFHGGCPVCGYRKGFEVSERQGLVLFRAHACGCTQHDVVAALREAGLWGRAPADAPPRPRPRPSTAPAPEADARAQEWALAIWRRTRRAAGTPAEAYLRSRCLTGAVPKALRFHEGLRHKATGTTWPAMVGGVQKVGADGLVAVHRTYLQRAPVGKAPVEPAKMTLGPVAGGAVRLADAGEHLAVSEGIETGLAYQDATGAPTWAALTAVGIELLVLPPLPLARHVTIAADHDERGRRAAEVAAAKWEAEGRTVIVDAPPKPGTDWADAA